MFPAFNFSPFQYSMCLFLSQLETSEYVKPNASRVARSVTAHPSSQQLLRAAERGNRSHQSPSCCSESEIIRNLPAFTYKQENRLKIYNTIEAVWNNATLPSWNISRFPCSSWWMQQQYSVYKERFRAELLINDGWGSFIHMQPTGGNLVCMWIKVLASFTRGI